MEIQKFLSAKPDIWTLSPPPPQGMALKKLVFGEIVTCHHLEETWHEEGMLARKLGQCPWQLDSGPREVVDGRNRCTAKEGG